MNHAAITREELLQAAERVAQADGLGELSIRRIAADCKISVGCIYNYYPSKADLIFALVESFWKRTFASFMTAQGMSGGSFVVLVEVTYQHLLVGLHSFTDDFLQQLSRLQSEEKRKGRAMEEQSFTHMKKKFLLSLAQDQAINPAVWSSSFTPEAYADFVFAAMMTGLRRNEPDCGFLLEIIRRTLYSK